MSEQKIYILSTGRAGTTFLYKFFEKHYPEFEITHQTKWSRVINILGNLPFGQQFNYWLIKKAFKLLKNENIPFNTLDPLLSIPITNLLIQKPHKNIKVIHLVRHPQKFAESFMAWKFSSISKIVLHYLIPFWQPVGYFYGVSFLKWFRLSKYEKFCWIWDFKNKKFNSLNANYNYQLIQMEELTSPESQQAWEKLITFIGLPIKEINYNSVAGKKINKSNSLSYPKSVSLQKKQLALCILYCRSLAKNLGYTI